MIVNLWFEVLLHDMQMTRPLLTYTVSLLDPTKTPYKHKGEYKDGTESISFAMEVILHKAYPRISLYRRRAAPLSPPRTDSHWQSFSDSEPLQDHFAMMSTQPRNPLCSC